MLEFEGRQLGAGAEFGCNGCFKRIFFSSEVLTEEKRNVPIIESLIHFRWDAGHTFNNFGFLFFIRCVDRDDWIGGVWQGSHSGFFTDDFIY